MFYAVASSPAMFHAVKRLVRDTIGRAGLIEQLRHNCAKGTNVLMKASKNQEVSVSNDGYLGDSHCFQGGASQPKTWPLEHLFV